MYETKGEERDRLSRRSAELLQQGTELMRHETFDDAAIDGHAAELAQHRLDLASNRERVDADTAASVGLPDPTDLPG